MLNKKRMKLIKQKLSSDCAICCMAMLTGIPHKKVIKLVDDCWRPKEGLGCVGTSLLRLGFKDKRVKILGANGRVLGYSIKPVDFKIIRCRYEISPEYFKDQIWGRRALLTVKSLNHKGGYHMVYWHYDKLYDPSTKKRYTDFKDLKPTQIAIFMEKTK